ncbi:MAG: NUDIX hydrolase [Candidatus Pacebacteria bacterium]|nr:NUDIX hydrolase [Candidatus Paceibacterota bacterium]
MEYNTEIAFSKDLWGEIVEVEFCPQETLPSEEELPLTAVSCIAVTDDNRRVVLAKVPRGCDLPGGHIESGEKPEDALARELEEETGARFQDKPHLIGIRRMTKKAETVRVQQYPLVSGIAVYIGRVVLDKSFVPQKESSERILVDVQEIDQIHHHWSRQEQEIFAYAKERYPDYFPDKI